MKNEEKYVSKAYPIEFGASSRASVKIKNNFYTFEASMKKQFPNDLDMSTVNMEEEWNSIWDELNGEVDNQITDCENSYEE